MGKGGGGGQTQTQESGPYEPARPYINDTFAQARDLYNSYFQNDPVIAGMGGGYNAFMPQVSSNPYMDAQNRITEINNQIRASGRAPNQQQLNEIFALQGQQKNAANPRSYATLVRSGYAYGRQQPAQPSVSSSSRLPALVQQGYDQLIANNNAGISPDILAAVANMRENALNNPLTAAARDQLQRTVSGEYLNADNPYFQEVSDRIRQNTLPQIDARYAAQGVGGGSAYQARSAADAVGGQISQLAYKNYQDERARMMQALGQVPQFNQAQSGLNQDLIRGGSLVTDLQNKLAQDRVALGTFPQDYRAKALQQYQNYLRGFNSSTSTSSSGGGGSNMFGNILGTALTVSSLFGNPASGFLNPSVSGMGTVAGGAGQVATGSSGGQLFQTLNY
jgi:hypothetical protein